MKKVVLAGFLLLFSSPLWSQTATTARISTGFAANEFTASLDGGRMHQLGKKQRLLLGYGLRYTHFRGSNVNYITAPAALTTKDKLDTLVLGSSSVNSFNAYVQLGYQFLPKWVITFDIDVIGASFGAERSGVFSSTEDASFNGLQKGSPTALNVLLVGDNDRGSLNSNFSLRYNVNENWQVQSGMTYLFTEFTTTQNLTDANDRFRRKSTFFMLGLQYRF